MAAVFGLAAFQNMETLDKACVLIGLALMLALEAFLVKILLRMAKKYFVKAQGLKRD